MGGKDAVNQYYVQHEDIERSRYGKEFFTCFFFLITRLESCDIALVRL